MKGFEPVTREEQELLELKCQENGWLKRGGYDWQDDPFMEEYPYEFARTESIDDLRVTLGEGNWAIRQGFLYGDLVFIQQVNGGDEWWTCKRFGDEWVDFESWSFERIAQEPDRFEDAILHMQYATKEECRSLRYMDSKIPEQKQGLASKVQGAIEASDALKSDPLQVPRPSRDR